MFPKRIPAYTQPIPFFNNQNIHDKEEQVCEDSSNGDRQLYNGLRKNPSNGNYVVNEANEEVHYGNLLMNESSQKNRVNINRDGYDSLRRSSKNFVIQNRSNFMQEKTPLSGPAFKRMFTEEQATNIMKIQSSLNSSQPKKSIKYNSENTLKVSSKNRHI